METKLYKENEVLNVALDGRLDTVTSPEVEKEILANMDGITKVIFDFSKLEYISSAGLRLLLLIAKKVGKDNVILHNVNSVVSEIINISGFNQLLKIE